MKILTNTGRTYDVDIGDKHVDVKHGDTAVKIDLPEDKDLVYSALSFPDPVVVRRNELLVGTERIQLGPIPVDGGDLHALEAFANVLEDAARFLRIASSNQAKLVEFKEALEPLGISVASPDALNLDVIEDGKTYEENALKKARAWAALTGQPTVADDSGIAVEGLNGEPGVHSARYSGVKGTTGNNAENERHKANNDKILTNLSAEPGLSRNATMSTVLVFQVPGEEPILFRADTPGRIADAPRGDNGWATDVLFIPDGQPPGEERTLAEMSTQEKTQYLPRKNALAMLLSYLEQEEEG